jgi:hypothetical protein
MVDETGERMPMRCSLPCALAAAQANAKNFFMSRDYYRAWYFGLKQNTSTGEKAGTQVSVFVM